MNNVTFVEAARVLAGQMLQHADDPQAAIEFGFRRLLARRPTSTEADLLNDAHAAFAAKYENEPSAALELLSIGETPRESTLDPAGHAAMTMTASLIMNLDEAITKE